MGVVCRKLILNQPKSSVLGGSVWLIRSLPCKWRLAFGVGVIQAQLEGFGLLDVTAERERTRPMFHRAYAECGWAPPSTLAP